VHGRLQRPMAGPDAGVSGASVARCRCGDRWPHARARSAVGRARLSRGPRCAHGSGRIPRRGCDRGVVRRCDTHRCVDERANAHPRGDVRGCAADRHCAQSSPELRGRRLPRDSSRLGGTLRGVLARCRVGSDRRGSDFRDSRGPTRAGLCRDHLGRGAGDRGRGLGAGLLSTPFGARSARRSWSGSAPWWFRR
jgi:hypothetical protein